ncbi:MAG: type VI secretion system lipoprotein TssJ [Ectothiorhodospiraceae bacterium]|nr:type VI secretion system lipoprotein TssJ [Ectothiorhodospiraceae bacterium]
MALITLILSAACTTMNTKVGGMLNLDSDLKINFLVETDINPDDNQTPSPLILRMYQLKAPTAFNKANFIDIYEKDTEILGSELVSRKKLKRIKPGENHETRFVLDPETKFVGIYAEFLKYKDADFKLIIPIAQTNVFSSTADVKISMNKLILVQKETPVFEESGSEEEN